MDNKELISLADKFLTPNYKRLPIAIVKGKGASVWDADGKKYIDFVTGIAVNNLGHCFTPVTKAIQKQLSRLVHTSNLYYTEPQAVLAKTLVENIYTGKVFFCNSGTEANEAALKLARKYSTDHFDKSRTEIIAFDGSFHGRTMGSLAMTGDKSLKTCFGAMLPGVKHVAYDSIEAVEKAISAKTCAVIIEPIQGEGGVRTPSGTFIRKLARLCSSRKITLIFDEVQTGFGRTGKLFAYEHFKIKPDIITMAKAIANGFPMGAMFAKDKLAKCLTPGSHASTFGGGPAACAGALATLSEIVKPEVLQNAHDMGRYMTIKLTGVKQHSKLIREVRGLGLLVGVELAGQCGWVVDKCAQMGLLVNCAGENTIRLMPPLKVKRTEMDKALNILEKILST